MKQKGIKEQYEIKIPKYKKLGENLSQAIEMLLNDESIHFLKVYHRIKKSDSFIGKIERKNFTKPFEEIEDICGIRIICYYTSEIDRICEIISKEFEVLTFQDKELLLGLDQFGYRSHHFIVKIKEEWLNTPNYRGLGDIKAEIQIRTNLMHTWAEIEHELGYKKDDDIPPEFRREFSILSAKLEEADNQFEQLRQNVYAYRKQSKREFALKYNEEVNLDVLQAFLDEYFPSREKSEDSTSYLVSELKMLDIKISKVIDLYERCKHLLPALEEAEKGIFEDLVDSTFEWAQVGVVRAILGLTLEGYLDRDKMPLDIYDLITEFRSKLN